MTNAGNSSSRAILPNPAPLLFLVAATAGWALLVEDPGPVGLLWLGVVASCLSLGAVRLLATRVETGVLALFVAVLMSRFYVGIGGLKARPEHIMIGLLGAVALFVWKRQPRPLRWIFADYLVIGYVALNILCSLVMSIDRAQTVKWALQQALVILPYFLLRIFAGERKSFRRAVHGLVAVGAAESAYSILCFFSNVFFNTTFGVEIGQYGDIPGTYGTLYEANLLGSFTGACFVMALILYFKERRPAFLVATCLTFCGSIVALSRAALIATAIAAGAAILVATRTGLADRRILRNLRNTVLLATLALMPFIVPIYVERFSTVNGSDITADANTATRLLTLAAAVNGIVEHPVLGNGTASFQLLVTYQELGFGAELEDSGTWIGNTEMRILHDLGIVGLALFIWLIAALAVQARRILKQELQPELLALVMAGLVYCIAFQATEGTLLAFSWVHLGLIGCGLALYQTSGRSEGASGE